MTASPDTIFALSSAPGKAGIAVIRVSGGGAFLSLSRLTQPTPLPPFRQAALRTLRNPDSGAPLDRALVLRFPAPGSFTGEECVEYHLHGSIAVVQGILDALSAMEGHRMAQPGEFTRRAFDNGKMDLTEAEAIADLIDAETEAQRQQALMQMGGALSRLYEGWSDRLTRCLAHVEAVIDFPDEDVPDEDALRIRPDITVLAGEMERHLNDNRRGERLREGISVAVIGAPNAGKSSLVNLLAQREVAIVSPMAGTTRDIIDVPLNIGGFPVILSDTAGLRPEQLSTHGHDLIESEGIRRAKLRAESADIRVLVFDGSVPELSGETLVLFNTNALVIINKCDLFHVKPDFDPVLHPIFVSTVTGEGVDNLLAELEKRIRGFIPDRSDTPFLTRQRHREAASAALGLLQHALSQTRPELMAESLRAALNTLGRITGRVDAEDLLDVIFRDFCIGK